MMMRMMRRTLHLQDGDGCDIKERIRLCLGLKMVNKHVAFMKLIKNFQRTQLALLLWCVQSRTLFHFYCSISGMCSLVNSNDVNFNDIICFVACAKKNVDLGFLSQTRLVMFLQHLKGFSNQFYRF